MDNLYSDKHENSRLPVNAQTSPQPTYITDNRPKFLIQRKHSETSVGNGKANTVLQRVPAGADVHLDSKGPVVGKSAIQLQDNRPSALVQRKPADAMNKGKPARRAGNQTGLPDNLKSGIENLSGHSMDDVKVHYNSDKPAQLQAHAYAHGTDIHLAPGQEKHLPHEAWHLAQQKQGRVKATMQMKGKVNVNDDAGLEREADVMGEKALQAKAGGQALTAFASLPYQQSPLVQLRKINVVVTGISHLVKMMGGSIMNGTENREISHGTEIVIDNEDKYRSRRGPNQEIFSGEDSPGGHNYRWFKVLNIGSEDVSAQNLYIRDQTFQADSREPISARPAAIDPTHRLRDPHQDRSTFAGHFLRRQSEMPAEFSSSVRQHVVKQWVQTKLPRVIAVEEDKGNKGKNNKGVFKVITADHQRFVVKVAVAPIAETFLVETRRRNEIRGGLGNEARHFAQIIDQEQDWNGLTLGLYPEAPGLTVGQAFEGFKAGAISSAEIFHIYNDVVTVLSHFNLENEKEGAYRLPASMAKTDGGLRAHNDANPDNILFHSSKGVSFIDNDGVTVTAGPADLERDVSSLTERFTPEIGVAAGREYKINPGAGRCQEIMSTVVGILQNIEDIYIEKIKNDRIKKLIKDICAGRLNGINEGFDKSKR